MLEVSKLTSVPEGQLQIRPLELPSKKDSSAEIFQGIQKTLLLSIVIPTYNESENLEPLLEQLTTTLDTSFADQYELILVDDNSPDLTWKLGLKLATIYPQLRVMRRQQEKGLSTAVIRGWQVACGKILGVIDADLQHPPDKLLSLLQKVLSGADLAVASRHVEGGGVSEWSFLRRFLSRGAQMLGLVILPNVVGRVTDPMSGYFLVKRSAIAGILLNPKGYKILLEVIGRGEIVTIAEVGYVFQERTEGESKVSLQHYIDYIRHLLTLRFRGRMGHFYRQLPINRFLRFGVVGFSGVFVDMLVLYLFHTGFGMELNPSKIISAEIAIINNFLLNDAWTFSDISRRQKGWKKKLRRFLKFNLICLAGLVLNVFVLSVVYKFVFGQRWPYLANLIAIASVTIWNFWMNLKLGWRVTQVDR